MASVDDQPALFVSYSLTHPLRRWGIVDERSKETADKRGEVPDRLVRRTWLCCSLALQTAGATFEGASYFGLPDVPVGSY